MARAKPDTTPINANPVYLSLDALEEHPDNPRSLFDESSLEELAASIREVGVLNPLHVAALGGGKYRILFGHRRARAARIAGCDPVPCILQHADVSKPIEDAKALELMLIEQLQHEGWHPIDEARGYRQLMDLAGYDAKALALKIGKSESYVFQRLKLLDLSEYAQATIIVNPGITASHAVLIARLDADAQNEIVDALEQAPMSTRELEAKLSEMGKRPKAEKSKPEQGRKEPEPATPVVEPAAPAGNEARVTLTACVEEGVQIRTEEPVVQKPKDAAEQFEEDVDRIGAELDAHNASLENAFHDGVNWALKEISWRPDDDGHLYLEVCGLIGEDVADLAICRAEAWHDSGDDSVGIPASSGVGLSKDQSGTLLERLVKELAHAKMRAHDLDDLLKLHEAQGTDEALANPFAGTPAPQCDIDDANAIAESSAGGEPETGSHPIDENRPSSAPSEDPPALEVVEGGAQPKPTEGWANEKVQLKDLAEGDRFSLTFTGPFWTRGAGNGPKIPATTPQGGKAEYPSDRLVYPIRNDDESGESKKSTPLYTVTRFKEDRKRGDVMYDRFDFVRSSDGAKASQYLRSEFVPEEGSNDYAEMLAETYDKISNWEAGQ